MIKILKETITSVKDTTRSLLVFEILFKIITTLCVVPLLTYLLDLTLKMTGYSYITLRNITTCLKNPLFVAMLLVIILIFALAMLYEIAILVLYFGHDFNNERFYFRKLFFLSLSELKRIFHPRNVVLLLYVICIVPLINFVTTSSFISSNLEIQEYFLNYIKKSDKLMIICVMILVMIFILSILMTFSFCYYFLEHKTLRESFVSSIRLIKGRVFKTVSSLWLCNIVFLGLYIAFYGIVIFLVGTGTKLMNEQRLGFVVFLSIFNLSNKVVVLVISSLEIITHFCLTVNLYFVYSGKKKKTYTLRVTKDKIKQKLTKGTKKMISLLIVIVVILNTLGIYYLLNDNHALLTQEKTKITSHRGNSIAAPENTIAALDYAVRDMADYAEIDVQETKDGVIILFHDNNLKRITGINKKIWKVTYDDIKDIDVGSWFSEEFSDQRIPTLDEVLKFCKGKIKLNIEIKPSGHEKNLEESVVHIIEENDFINDCVITSFNYSSLRKVKELNPDIRTGYILSAVYGKFYDLKYADFFSIEKSFVTEKVVVEAHKRGKEVHVWTINSVSYMEKMAKLGVDNIITDDPVKARNIIYSTEIPNYTLDFLNLIFDR